MTVNCHCTRHSCLHIQCKCTEHVLMSHSFLCGRSAVNRVVKRARAVLHMPCSALRVTSRKKEAWSMHNTGVIPRTFPHGLIMCSSTVQLAQGTPVMLGYLCDNIGLVLACLPSGTAVGPGSPSRYMTQQSGSPILSPVLFMHVDDPYIPPL